jgi:hypothetical protein
LIAKVKVKGKVVPVLNYTPRHEGVLEEWRYSFTHSLTSAIDGGEWSASRPGHCCVGPRAVLDAVVKRKIPSPPGIEP